MKNLNNLLVFMFAVLLVISCKNEVIEEVEEPTIVYYTHRIFKDSFYWPEATYINKTNLITYLDTIGDTTMYIAGPTCSKIVFDRENNISLRYLGGYRDTSVTCNDIGYVDIHYTQEYEDSINAIIYIPVDTVTVTRVTKFSYAIFEVTNGSEVSIDTAIYNLSDDNRCFNIYCCDPEDIYNTNFILDNYNENYINSLTTVYSIFSFIPYYRENYYIQAPAKNKKIYMIDLFPIKWGQIDSTQLIFFHLAP